MTPVDPIAIRAALERQLALLAPVAVHLRDAATGPSPLVDDEWRGPAADAADGFDMELRSRLRAADDAAEDAVRRLRIAIAGIS